MQTSWPFDFDPKYVLFLAALGVRRGNSSVTLDDEGLDIRFGRWTLVTPWTNVKDTQITRDYTAAKAIGARGSFTDKGVSFGTNTREGLCICFHKPVPALLGGPLADLMLHPGVTVTVVDCAGLEAEVRRRMAAAQV